MPNEETVAQENTEATLDTQEQQANDALQNTGTLAGEAGHQVESQSHDANGDEKSNSGNNQPAEPVQYDFSESVPAGMELDETASKEFGEIARGLNLDNSQANQLAKYGMAYAQKMTQALENQQAEIQKSWADETRQALGPKLNEELGYVGTALDKLEPLVPGLRNALNIGGIGNRVEIVRMLAQVGRMVAEDSGRAAVDTSAGSGVASRYPNTNFNNYK